MYPGYMDHMYGLKCLYDLVHIRMQCCLHPKSEFQDKVCTVHCFQKLILNASDMKHIHTVGLNDCLEGMFYTHWHCFFHLDMKDLSMSYTRFVIR